jgi:hypothetical protein
MTHHLRFRKNQGLLGALLRCGVYSKVLVDQIRSLREILLCLHVSDKQAHAGHITHHLEVNAVTDDQGQSVLRNWKFLIAIP